MKHAVCTGGQICTRFAFLASDSELPKITRMHDQEATICNKILPIYMLHGKVFLHRRAKGAWQRKHKVIRVGSFFSDNMALLQIGTDRLNYCSGQWAMKSETQLFISAFCIGYPLKIQMNYLANIILTKII